MTRNLPPIVRVDFDPKALDPLKRRALAELEGVQGMVIENDEDAKLAAAVLVSIAAVKKDAQKQSKEWLAPINAEHDRIRSPFKAIEDACDDARKIVDKAGGAYVLSKAKAERLALAEATKAVIADDTKALTTALQARDAAAPVALAGVSFKAFWVAEVTNPGVVPPAFCAPDLKKIGAHASACSADSEPTPIPGVRFKLETSSTVRTKGLV